MDTKITELKFTVQMNGKEYLFPIRLTKEDININRDSNVYIPVILISDIIETLKNEGEDTRHYYFNTVEEKELFNEYPYITKYDDIATILDRVYGVIDKEISIILSKLLKLIVKYNPYSDEYLFYAHMNSEIWARINYNGNIENRSFYTEDLSIINSDVELNDDNVGFKILRRPYKYNIINQ